MTHVRLLPALLIAVVGLFFIKVTHIVANSGDYLSSTAPAQAQEAPKDPVAEAKNGGVANQSDDTKAADAVTGKEGEAKKGGDSQEPPALVEGMKVNPNQSSRSELALLERLARRREKLAEREKELEMRDALLKAAEKRLQERVNELKDLEKSIQKASRLRREEKQEDLGKLVAMYQSMKPKQAAKIFEVLDSDMLVEVAKIMKPRKLAAIMGQMKPSAASALSVAIARGKSLEDDVKKLANNELPKIGN